MRWIVYNVYLEIHGFRDPEEGVNQSAREESVKLLCVADAKEED